MRITVIGAGAWGTAIALAATRHPAGHHVTLWVRNATQASAMQAQGTNTRYLPGIPLPHRLAISHAPLAEASHDAQLLIIATPTSALRDTLHTLAATRTTAPVAWLCKGFEAPAPHCNRPGLMPHEVCAEVAPALAVGALSGPSFAQEVATAQPTCLVAASRHDSVRQALLDAFHTRTLRLYANEDIVGVEVGGAVKNVLAIAAGLCDGLHLGLNARAALLTRGLAEMTRLGVALGAQAGTFMGLSGMGDLMLTATGDLSRNRKIGLLLAQGMSLPQAVNSLGHVAEGVYSARTVAQRARTVGVDIPIAATVVQLLDGHITPADAVRQLMERDPKHENA